MTHSISAHRVQIDNQQVVLLDTPGFDDTFRSDAEILIKIAQWLAASYVETHQLTGIIYLHRISDVRIGGSARRNLTMLRKLAGDDALHNVTFITNRWDQVEESHGAARERELVDNPNFWGGMVRLGSTVARFDGTTEGTYTIIRSLLNRIMRPLNIQKEMIDDHLQLADTEAGKEVLANISELKLQHQREISELRSLMEETRQQNDKAASMEVAELSREYDRKLALTQTQIDKLQSRNPEIEALQIRYEQEMLRFKDSMEARMRFLEEQASDPPPAYAEAGMTSDEDVRGPSQSIMFRLWTLFICFRKFYQRILRPKVPPGYRRLEWACVCFLLRI